MQSKEKSRRRYSRIFLNNFLGIFTVLFLYMHPALINSGWALTIPPPIITGNYVDEESDIQELVHPDVLRAGEKFYIGQTLTSQNQQYFMKLEADGNLTVRRSSDQMLLWQSNSPDTNASYLILQTDGNLVIYDSSGARSIWRINDVSQDFSSARYLQISDIGLLAVHSDQGKVGWINSQRYDGVRFLTPAMKNYNGNLMCMDVSGANTANGTNIQLWDCNNFSNGNAQAFIYNAMDHRIRLKQDPTKCLDVSNNNRDNGTNIQLYDCYDHYFGLNYAQLFEYDKASGHIRLFDGSNKCISVSPTRNPTNLNGTNIELWDCYANDGAQTFDMVVAQGSGIPTWINGTALRKRNAPDKCIDIANSSMQNGANIQLYQCNGTNAQNFTYNKLDGTIRVTNNPNKCLDLAGGNTGNSTNIQLYDCVVSSGNQSFDYDFVTGQINLRKDPGKCIDVAGNWNSNGTNIQLYECNNTTAQQFDINGQLNRFAIDIRKLNGTIKISVNGIERINYMRSDGDVGLVYFDPLWFSYGNNEVNISLVSTGGTPSLAISLFRNMEYKPAITRGIFGNTTNWKYQVNTVSGRIYTLQ